MRARRRKSEAVNPTTIARLVASIAVVAVFAPEFVSAVTTDAQQEIARFYKQALAGDKTAVELCIARLESALQQEPGNQLARVYLGSAYTLRSRDLSFGPKKLEALKHGLTLMDAAVAAAPDDPHVRLVRAHTTDSLPFFVGRKRSTLDDFELLLAAARKHPDEFKAPDLQNIYLDAGNVRQARGEKARAVELWQEGLRQTDNTAVAEKLRAAIVRSK